MDIILTYIVPAATLIIALVSLCISIKVYRRDTPQISIEIDNPKYDCYFAQVHAVGKGEKPIKARVAGINLILRNHSSADIQVFDAKLKIKRECYRLIPPTIDCWSGVAFLTRNEETGELEPDPIFYPLNYKEDGLTLPAVVKGYSSISKTTLFYHFPAGINRKVRATIFIKTAVGVAKKHVWLLAYNNNLLAADWEDYQQYQKSCE